MFFISHVVSLGNTTNSLLFVFRAFTKIKSSAVCSECIMCWKFHFSQWKIYFSQFNDNFLKFEEMKNLIHYVWNENILLLFKLTISFSTVKLKLGTKFSQFIHRFRYSYNYDSNMRLLSVGLILYFQVLLDSQRDFGIF